MSQLGFKISSAPFYSSSCDQSDLIDGLCNRCLEVRQGTVMMNVGVLGVHEKGIGLDP